MKTELAPNPADIHGPNAGEPGYSEIKKKINAGGDDLYIGTKDEIEKAKALVESEGHAPDLATYIRMHKKLPMTNEQFKTLVTEKGWVQYYDDFMTKPTGYAVFQSDQFGGGTLYYKDASGNIASVEFDAEKIDELKDEVAHGGVGWVSRLSALGFSVSINLCFFTDVEAPIMIQQYTKYQRDLQQQKVKQEFSF
ncbi:MAG: hypothetical protein UT32_C0008G0007 [Parcubacteria group bacterium GW2011_GWC2_39_14]|nr:MAG: hypothetical protein UT32_C0008G0007 [Parcubacteria group bacterium GW2011_GWC2_39_14]KKR54928.1 MAG: hypothetical protein UT91_C0007G0029 [Parcubacteria group bacterium GW2011_GWA2_40_23]